MTDKMVKAIVSSVFGLIKKEATTTYYKMYEAGVEMWNGNVYIELPGGAFVTPVTQAIAKCKFPMIEWQPGDETPDRKAYIPKGTTFGLHLEEVVRAYSAVRHSVSDDDTRTSLQGIHFDGKHVVATDGHRMAVAEDRGCGFSPPENGVTIMAHVADALFVGAATLGGSLSIVVSEDAAGILWQNEDMLVIVKNATTQSLFPDWEQVVSKTFRWKIEGSGVWAALQTVPFPPRITKRANEKPEVLVIGPDTATWTGFAHALGDKVESSTIELPVEVSDFCTPEKVRCKDAAGRPVLDENGEEVWDQPENYKIGFKVNYVIDALPDDTSFVSIRGNSPLDPIIVETMDGTRHVIMPMRL